MAFRIAGTRASALLWPSAYLLSLAGLLAPVLPAADFLNHFRGLACIGCLGVCLAGGWRSRHVIAITAVNGVLAIAPVAVSAAATTGVGDAVQPGLKLIAFNVWTGNPEWRQAARWLVGQDADVVVLLELRRDVAPRLLAELATVYPHQVPCLGKGCGMAIVARRPLSTRAVLRRGEGPPLIDVDTTDGRGRAIRVIGTHLQRLDKAAAQRRELAFLRRHLGHAGSGDQQTLVVGDFNLTPWSIQLALLARDAGLVRHGWWHTSWPSGAFHPALFLIDHVLSTPGVRTQSISAGPHLGSDHRAIVGRLVFR